MIRIGFVLFVCTNLALATLANNTNVTTPDNQQQEQPHYTITLPICCDVNQMLDPSGCKNSNDTTEFWPSLGIHWHNDTHFETTSFTKNQIVINTKLHNIKCEHERYVVSQKEDRALLLLNSTLIIMYSDSNRELRGFGEYCIAKVQDTPDGENQSVTLIAALVCFGSEEESQIGYFLYAAGLILSAMCLVFIAILFFYKQENLNTEEGKCIVCFVLSFAISFLVLAIAQITGLNEDVGCHIVGFILQFFLVLSFSWLSLYALENYRAVIEFLQCNGGLYLHTGHRKLLRWTEPFRTKVIIGFVVPAFILILSVMSRVIPIDYFKTNIGNNQCFLHDSSEGLALKALLLHLPILLLLACSIGFVIMGRIKLEKLKTSPFFQIRRRACYLVILLMSICWFTNFITSICGSATPVWMAIDIINTLQGIMIMILILQVTIKIEGRKVSFRRIPTKELINNVTTNNDCTTALNSGNTTL